jgi:putative transposase
VFSRKALAIEVGHQLRGEHVVEVLNRLIRQRRASRYLFADNGSEFSGHVVDLWADHHQVRIDFSRLGKPTDNAYIDTFNGSLRDECLNLHWFENAGGGGPKREPSSHGSRQHRACRICDPMMSTAVQS